MTESSDSDDLPLAARAQPNGRERKPAGAMAEADSASQGEGAEDKAADSDSDSESDVPLAVRQQAMNQQNGRRHKPVATKADDDSDEEDDDDDDDDADDDSEDDAGRKRKRITGGKAKANGQAKRARTSTRASAKSTPSKAKPAKKDDRSVKWQTLEHGGVLFPPEYVPHGVKLKYDGVPVDLTTEQEEVATMFAAMLETDYVTQKKEQFMKNFWIDFKHVLGPKHVIKTLDKCDFRDIYNHLMEEREAKKSLSKEEKMKLKEEKETAEAKYKFALVDGNQEPVGNFRVEPPGLFRGRGEHPKMGKLKCRIYPRDITINIGKGVSVPTHPYKDQEWKEVRHDNTVTWLAYWKDPIDARGYKYVWLGANSTFKTEADLEKYEKARKLKDHIDRIRNDYRRLWKHKDVFERQKSTALYFIDVLALRAGHEKDEDEADTVGCCTLKAENVEMLEDNKIKFDFLGKDSIRYENVVDVDPEVWKNMKDFKARDKDDKKKKGEDQLFDTMCAQDLNVMMKNYMDGLSVKVFRTYNASVTLNRLLFEDTESEDVVSHKADYDRANKEVAILCNHQRAVPKTHEKSMQAMDEKIEKAEENLNSLKKDLKLAKAGKATQDGKNKSPDVLQKQVNRAQESLNKLKVTKNSKEELKTVALGTSKINYLDPRITVAWCKRKDVPLEKIFNKSLLGKFTWAMEVEPAFAF